MTNTTRKNDHPRTTKYAEAEQRHVRLTALHEWLGETVSALAEGLRDLGPLDYGAAGLRQLGDLVEAHDITAQLTESVKTNLRVDGARALLRVLPSVLTAHGDEQDEAMGGIELHVVGAAIESLTDEAKSVVQSAALRRQRSRKTS